MSDMLDPDPVTVTLEVTLVRVDPAEPPVIDPGVLAHALWMDHLLDASAHPYTSNDDVTEYQVQDVVYVDRYGNRSSMNEEGGWPG